jgi:tetratricopeptide (TPR) repeat protein
MTKNTKSIIGALVVVGLIIAGYAYNRHYTSPDAQFDRLAQQYGDNSIFRAMEPSLKRNLFALAKEPKNPDYLNALGTNFYVLEDYDTALEYYGQVLELTPDNFLAHYNAANAYKQLKNYPKAEEHYRKAIEINPEYITAYFSLDELFTTVLTDKKDQMEQMYKDAIAKYPTNENFKLALNDFYRRTGQMDKIQTSPAQK